MKIGWILRREGFRIPGPFLFLMGALLIAPFAHADEDAHPSPARAARLGFVKGQVKISQGGQVLADPAPANSPLFEGTEVAAGENGRAEIQFEDGSVARLSPNSALSLKVLRAAEGGNETEIVLERGLAYFELQAAENSERFRVRFGDTVTTANGFTVFRVNLDRDPGEVAVFSGNAHVERGSSVAADLHGGESVALNPNDATEYDLSESIEPDSWDAWNADRDRALQGEYGQQTDATKGQENNPAWADLDSNGNWYNVPDQGYVWSPYDAASPGWDPYGYGNWMWTPAYGYTWVSGYPWGYMPFQCGSWNYYGAFGWGWAPGIGNCQTWWNAGGGWGYRIGHGPAGYRFPIRPRSGPPRRPLGSLPQQAGKTEPHPLVPVNRRPGGIAPVQNRPSVVSIHGQPVQALRPIAPRQPYSGGFNTGHPGAGIQGSRPATPGNGFVGGRPSYAPPARPTQPVYVPNHPAGGQPNYAPNRTPSAPPPSRPSGGASAPHPAPSAGGGAPHAPAGGGGGGAPHSGGGGSPHH